LGQFVPIEYREWKPADTLRLWKGSEAQIRMYQGFLTTSDYRGLSKHDKALKIIQEHKISMSMAADIVEFSTFQRVLYCFGLTILFRRNALIRRRWLPLFAAWLTVWLKWKGIRSQIGDVLQPMQTDRLVKIYRSAFVAKHLHPLSMTKKSKHQTRQLRHLWFDCDCCHINQYCRRNGRTFVPRYHEERENICIKSRNRHCLVLAHASGVRRPKHSNTSTDCCYDCCCWRSSYYCRRSFDLLWGQGLNFLF
jgi:hypothetical protein